MSDENKAALEALENMLLHIGSCMWTEDESVAIERDLSAIRAALTRPEPRVVEVDECFEDKCPYLDITNGSSSVGMCTLAPRLGKPTPDMGGTETPVLCPLRAGDVLLRLRGGK